MDFEFKLPDIGEGLVEGEIVKWFVREGDAIAENAPLAAVLTDKAEVEIPSPRTGTVVKLCGRPGEKIKVHAPLAVIAVAGASAPAPRPSGAPASPPAPSPSRPLSAPPAAAKVLATPLVRKLAKDLGVDPAAVRGTGPEGRVLEADVRAAAGARQAAPAARATPAVAALAASLGVDAARLKATGPGGRLSEADVRAAARGAAPAAPAPAPAALPAAPRPAGPAGDGEERVPFAGVRRKIAERMSASKRAVADVTHVEECDMTALLALREELKPQAAARGLKLTPIAFVIRALVMALKDFPVFNASLDEAAGEIVLKKRYNIGIAVAAPQGLVVPNIKGADGKDLFGLAAEVAALAEKVRANKIDVASLQGGTFTVTNIGPIGGIYANPIVNHPEAAILGLMKLRRLPVWRDGGILPRDMMNLCLTFDHRVADGADAAHFMNAVVSRLENPRTLL